MTISKQLKCANCGTDCSMNAEVNGWFCRCVSPCPHADQGPGWYITTRRERVVEVVDAIYYVKADSPADALLKISKPGTIRERAIQRRISKSVEPESEWSPAAYDFNDGMGR